MRKINLLILAIFTVILIYGCDFSLNPKKIKNQPVIIINKKQLEPIDEGWIKLPKYFKNELNFDLMNGSTIYSIELQGTPYIAGYYINSNKLFRLEISLPEWGKRTDVPESFDKITSLNIPEKYVNKEYLNKAPKDLISYDPVNKIVTFDLGNGIFKYKLKKQVDEKL